MPAPKPISYREFGGLVLNRPLDDTGKNRAIDLLDVDWEGMLKSREGAEAFTPEAGAANYESLFAHSDSHLLARRGETTLVALKNSDGKETGKTATTKKKHLSFTRLGTPAASYTFIADTESTIKRYDGTNFTEPTATVDEEAGKAMPKGQFLATWIDEGNRLVVAGTAANGGPNGATSSSSHVWFSNPGEPEGFASTAYEQLNPGDGEDIVGCCVWGGQVFVFKETRLFVFGGVSPDAEGNPIFNFRTVDLGTRLLPPSVAGGPQVVAGGEGVYFVANDGLWMTTGGEPALLSEDLDPLADSQALIGPAATTFGELRWTDAKGIEFANNAVYVGLGESSVTRLLKFDLRTLRWTVWTAALNCLAAWNEDTTTHRTRVYFSASSGELKHVYLYTPAKEEDPTVAAMAPRWQSGFDDIEDDDEKTFTDVKMWGSGEVDLKVAEDYGALGKATTYKLGIEGAIAQDQKNKDQAATLFSFQLSGEAPWSVQRLARYLREKRVPETKA